MSKKENKTVKQKSKLGFCIKLVVTFLIGLFIFNICSFEVAENEYVCVKRFSKVVSIKDSAGLSFKIPIIDTLQRLPRTKMYYDLKPSDVLTSDKKSLVVDNYIVWKITDPLKFIKTINYVSEMERRLDTSIYSAIKNNIGQIPQAQMIALEDSLLDEVTSTINELSEEGTTTSIDKNTSKRDSLNDEILKDVNRQIENYGVKAEFIEIKRLDLPGDNETAVYSRMISERNRIAKAYTAEGKSAADKIKNDTNKQVENILSEANGQAAMIKGEGEAEAMKILKETYNNPQKADFFKFIKSLEALENSMIGEDKTVVLSKDSPISEVFLQNNK